MALSEAMHHSALRGAWHVSNAALRGQKPDRAGEAAGTEFYAMSEVDELPAAGVRPPSLGEPPGSAVKVGRVLQPGAFERPSLDVPVLQMEDQLVDVLGYFSTLVPVVAEQVIEVPKVVSPPRAARTVLCAPQTAEQLVAVPTEPGYALAVVAVQTLGWRDARAQHRQARAGYKYWPPRRGLRRAVVDVSVIMQLMFQQSTVEFFKVPQLQFIDRVVIFWLRDRDRYTVQTVQKTVEYRCSSWTGWDTRCCTTTGASV